MRGRPIQTRLCLILCSSGAYGIILNNFVHPHCVVSVNVQNVPRMYIGEIFFLVKKFSDPHLLRCNFISDTILPVLPVIKSLLFPVTENSFFTLYFVRECFFFLSF